VGLYSFETNEYKIIQNGGYAKYIPTGHLIYTSGRRLYAAPFDLKSDNFTGPPVQIFEDIVMNFPIGDVAYYSFSDTGLLVYARMIPGQSQNRLVWIDWQGTVSPVTEQQRGYRWPRISPDGSKVALTIIEGDEYDVWIYDIKRDTFTQFTFDGDNDLPIWTPDGNWITFNSTREGSWDLFRKRADASGKAEKLSTAKYHHLPTSWSPDGKSLAYTDVSDIWILSLDDERKSQPFIQTPIDEGEARFSPDGRHIAFCTNDSGLFEVNVAAFPGPGGKYQVSKEGGCDPIWNPNGKQLYYRKDNNIMVVDIETESGFLTSKPRVLYEAPYIGGYTDYRSYDITPDGQRFIAVEKTPALTQIDVVFDWFEIIKSRIPSEQNY
jgi:serine/threonine-protein kinase